MSINAEIAPADERDDCLALATPTLDRRSGEIVAFAPRAGKLSENSAAVYLASLGSDESRRTARTALNVIAGILTSGQADAFTMEWGLLRFQHCSALRARVAERYSVSTANHRLSVLRSVLKTAWHLGQISTDDYHKAVAIGPVRGETLPRGRALTTGELRAVFADCATKEICTLYMDGLGLSKNQISGARDAALLALLYGCGLRRSEAVSLNLSDYAPETGALKVLRAKGNKDRMAYASEGARSALFVWLKFRGDEPGPLFLPVLKSGRIVPRRLTKQAVLMMITKRADQAGVQKFSPHDLRRTFISHLLEAGADISIVQQMAGHANVATTTRYDRRGEKAKQKASELLHVPFAS